MKWCIGIGRFKRSSDITVIEWAVNRTSWLSNLVRINTTYSASIMNKHINCRVTTIDFERNKSFCLINLQNMPVFICSHFIIYQYETSCRKITVCQLDTSATEKIM